MARMIHIDDTTRLEGYRELLTTRQRPVDAARDPVARMLVAALGYTKRPLSEIDAAFDEIWSAPAIRAELLELLAIANDRRGRTWPLVGRLASLVLRVHGTYGLDEVMAAIDERDAKGAIRRLREGVFSAKAHRADLLFVTLQKSESDYSPTTMYRDFPISAKRFHWESQSAQHAGTETGRRYVEHAARDHAILLFVRQKRSDRPDVTAPYTFLGPVRYVKHEGARPMAIEWELEREMPAWLFQEVKVAAGS